MRQTTTPKVLKLRMKEAHDRLGFFLFDERATGIPQAFSKSECVRLLHRIVGGQNYTPNLKTVWFVFAEYIRYWWFHYEFELWHFSQKKLYRKTDDEIENLLSGGVVIEDEEEWPDEVSA